MNIFYTFVVLDTESHNVGKCKHKLMFFYFNDALYPLRQYLEAKLQGVQRCAASFAKNCYAKMADVAGLGWLGECSYSGQPCKVRHFLHLSFTGHSKFYILVSEFLKPV